MLSLVRGEFLEGLDLPACYAYHEWCMSQRDAASGLHEQILLALIGRAHGVPTRQLAHARTLVGLNPLSEPGHLALIRALVALGRHADARAEHAQCGRIFAAELGIAPPAAIAEALATRPADPAGSDH